MKQASVLVGLSNPKSPTNVGAAVRAAGCYQADAVAYTGHRYDNAARFYTDTQPDLHDVALVGVDCLLEDLPSDMKVVCVELAEGATMLPQFIHPEKAIYIFGPEDGSISQDVADRADHVVYVPTIGCMNLAASVNVVLYDRLAKRQDLVHCDDFVRRNRDNKNNLQVKSA